MPMREILNKYLEFTEEIREEIRQKYSRELTVMFTDIAGSTQYYEQKGDVEGRAMFQKHNNILFPIIESHNGRIMKTIGDSIMACFENSSDGVVASANMQKALFENNKDGHTEIHIRIGLHIGVSLDETTDAYGTTVNIAARVSSLASADQILVSETTYNEIKQLKNIRFHSHGPRELKGIKDKVSIYEVLWHQNQVPKELMIINTFESTQKKKPIDDELKARMSGLRQS